jgi:hypothetical protein
VGGKVALEQVFSDYFGFRSQFSFHQMFRTHLPFAAGKKRRLMSGVPHEIKKKGDENLRALFQQIKKF